ncbi:MAG: sigma-70 family RNA polymerase sigma factor [Aggregatilineales bacterium]
MAEDDAQLIRDAQAGDLEAFNALVLRYQDAVYSVTFRIMGDPASADDGTQESFLNAFRRLDTYRGGNFRAWLLRVATNTCYDILRYHKRRPATALDDLPGGESDDGPPLPDQSKSPEEAMQETELSDAIQSCINGLSDDQRVVIVMSDIEGYNYQDIADAIDTQLGTVKSRLSRARNNMRKCLQAFQELLPSEYRLSNE